jgi:hypothetical protein
MSASNPPATPASEKNIVTVIIQSGRNEKSFEFPKTAKVSEVIDKAVEAFGFVKGDKFELFLPPDLKTALDPNRPLVSYKIENGTKLILTAMGGGVWSMAVDPDISGARMREELSAARSLARSFRWGLIPNFAELTLLAAMYAYNDDLYIVTMRFDNYREIPPWIDFIDPETGIVGSVHAYPRTHDSFSHDGGPCLCAPVNRKAYQSPTTPNAPHGDWAMANWATSTANGVNWANYSTIGDILNLIQRRLLTPETYLGRKW